MGIRPSAADVMHFILDTMTTSAIQASIDASLDEYVKDRVSSQLQADSPTPLNAEDVRTLRKLVESGDSTAAFLLGRATWKRLAVPDDNVLPLLSITEENYEEGE
ncbi:hypothetical protein H2198_006322 [Neophaeococcomyces mojaviensis]|uniref:Uncharacterized protein n=1 Tax=Neophaeococcomyces mojaviensis TaxID=3383035 RepID=A0ACC3A3Q6_9EURO|nr:hypothetical protein H2198_006322 [Knufia sp. JES_112]